MAYFEQPSFFDQEEPGTPLAWREVPQARFFSWSQERQLSYCALRDEDSAKSALEPSWAEFYLNRAKTYRELLNAKMDTTNGKS